MAKKILFVVSDTDYYSEVITSFPDYNWDLLKISSSGTKKKRAEENGKRVQSYFSERNMPSLIFVDTLAEHSIPLIKHHYTGAIVGVESIKRTVSGADETIIFDFEHPKAIFRRTIEKYLGY